MQCIRNLKHSVAAGFIMATLTLTPSIHAACEENLFTIKAEAGTRISEMINQLIDQCDLTLIIMDDEATKKLKSRLNRLSLTDASLPEILAVILSEHNLNYSLQGNVLKISYLMTQTFHIDYVSTDRTSNSTTNVMLSSGGGTQQTTSTTGTVSTATVNQGESQSGIQVLSDDKFIFWADLESQVNKILNRPEDEYTAGTPVIDREAGLITITGTKKQIDRVAGYIDELVGRLRKQVLIDVKMYSVTLTDGHETGIDWREIYKLQSFNVSGEIFRANTNVGEITFPDSDTSPSITQILTGGKTATFTDIVMNAEIGTIVKFLQTQGDVNSISNPKVLTLNNQAALITSGKQYFYKITNSTTTSNTGGSTVAQNEIIDSVFAGILLDITPEISKEGTITLKINPSISDTIDVVTNDSTTRTMPPDLERRQMSTVVTVDDGEHVILGGLISDRISNDSYKVPLLGDIPLLGYAFKYEGMSKEKVEMVMIVTPHIVGPKGGGITLKELGYNEATIGN